MGAFLPALIGGGLNLLGGLFGGHQQNKQATDQANLQNQYNQNYGAGQQNYLKYLQGLGPQTNTGTGSFGSNGSSTNTGTSSNTGVNQGTSSFAPTVSAQFSPLVGRINSMLQTRLGSDGLPIGYASAGMEGINNSFAGAKQAAANQAARFGVTGPQAMALQAPAETARAGQMASFQANLPLQARSFQNEDMATAMNLANIFGKGQTGTNNSTSNQIGNTSQFGTNNNSGFNNSSMTGPRPIAGMGAFLPPGSNQSTVAPNSMLGMGLQGVGDLLSAWGMQQGRKAYQDSLNGGGGNNWLQPGQIGTGQMGPGADLANPVPDFVGGLPTWGR